MNKRTWIGLLALACLALAAGCGTKSEPSQVPQGDKQSANAPADAGESPSDAAKPDDASAPPGDVTAGAMPEIGQIKAIGKTVPNFRMTLTDGKTITDQDLRGKVVLIDFWASWCGPCKLALPILKGHHEKYGAQGLVVIGANLGEEKPGPDVAKAYQKEHGLPYLVSYNNDPIGQSWGVMGYPFFMLIDKQGVIRKILPGYSEEELGKNVASEIEKLLKA